MPAITTTLDYVQQHTWNNPASSPNFLVVVSGSLLSMLSSVPLTAGICRLRIVYGERDTPYMGCRGAMWGHWQHMPEVVGVVTGLVTGMAAFIMVGGLAGDEMYVVSL